MNLKQAMRKDSVDHLHFHNTKTDQRMFIANKSYEYSGFHLFTKHEIWLPTDWIKLLVKFLEPPHEIPVKM